MKKHLTIILCTIFLLTSCVGRSGSVSAEPLKVEFAYWWGDFTLLVAQEKGFFEKHGVQVTPIYYESFSQAPADLAAGGIDAGLFSIGDSLLTSEKIDVVVVAVYDDGGLNTVVAAPEIQSVADLKGKQIGVKVGSPYEIFVREMLKSAGLTVSDVVLVNLSAEEIPSLMPDTVQAGFVWEPYTTELVDAGNHVLFSSEQISSLYPDLVTFRASVVRERPDDVRAFLAAWFEAVEYRKTHVEETREIAAKYLGVPIDEVKPDGQLQLMSLADNRLLYQASPGDASRSIYDTARISADFLINIGSLSDQPVFETIFDPSYLP